MAEQVNIEVTTYNKNQLQQAVNTKFTQLGVTTAQTTAVAQTISVNEFFALLRVAFEFSFNTALLNPNKVSAGKPITPDAGSITTCRPASLNFCPIINTALARGSF